MFSFARLVPFFVISLQYTLSAAYSWQFTAPPTQCSNLAISIVGSDGQPPYHVLIFRTGDAHLPNNKDPRHIIDQVFDGDSTSISLPINYPANSQFVAVVSDATGFGTGGASVETTVANSDDSSCFDPTKTWKPPFVYGVGNTNKLTQCHPAFVWWSSTSQGNVKFVGVIPGGQSFVLPESSLSIEPSLGTGFMWIPDISAGTTFYIVAGDDRGLGSGGSAQIAVQLSSNATCLNSGSPSSTPGIPAGSLQTTTSTSVTSSSTPATSTSSTMGTNTGNVVGASTSNAARPSASNAGGNSANDTTSNGGGGPNVGVIVAGTVGGIIGLFIVIALVVMYLSHFGRSRRDRPLLPSMGQVNNTTVIPENTLAHYSPEPFAYAGAGSAVAYNHGYSYSGQGYVEGMAPGATSVVPPPVLLRNNPTSGGGTRISDISSPIRDSWYGQPPSQEDSYGLPQTSALASLRSEGGSGVYDMSSQSSRHLIPSSSSSRGVSPEQLQTGGLASMTNGGGIAYRTSIQKGSRHLAPSPLQGASSGLPASGLGNMRDGGGVIYATSSQSGSRHIAPSVTSSTSGPANMRESPNPFVSPEEPPPAFSSLDVDENHPTGDVKYNIMNAE